jgi:hypothetical protein
MWATFNISFLWVDEFFQPLFPKSFKNMILQKYLKGFVFFAHVVLWFYSAGLVHGHNFWSN